MVELFTEDCIFQAGSGAGQLYIETKSALFAHFTRTLTERGIRAPMITNMTIELESDQRAQSVCLMANPLVPAGAPFVGYYLDDYRKVDGRWLFSARRFYSYAPESHLDGARSRGPI